MRWAYKMVLYPLQKDGFLGSSFIDETEMECSLNEYGKAGWELVSLLEGVDGFRAVFKQPFAGQQHEEFIPAAIERPIIASIAAVVEDDESEQELPVEPAVEEKMDDTWVPEIRINEEKAETDTVRQDAPLLFGAEEEADMPDEDVGSIRIE